MKTSTKLPAFSGYCPPGQLRSMSRRLAIEALEAHRRRMVRADALTLAGLVATLLLTFCCR